MAAVVDDLILAAIIAGGGYALKGLWDTGVNEPKRIKLQERILQHEQESSRRIQAAQTTGQKQAYESEMRAAQEFMKQQLAMRREEMNLAASIRRQDQVSASQDRQLEVLGLFLQAMNRPRARRVYAPPPYSMAGLIGG